MGGFSFLWVPLFAQATELNLEQVSQLWDATALAGRSLPKSPGLWLKHATDTKDGAQRLPLAPPYACIVHLRPFAGRRRKSQTQMKWFKEQPQPFYSGKPDNKFDVPTVVCGATISGQGLTVRTRVPKALPFQAAPWLTPTNQGSCCLSLSPANSRPAVGSDVERKQGLRIVGSPVSCIHQSQSLGGHTWKRRSPEEAAPFACRHLACFALLPGLLLLFKRRKRET